MNRSKKLICIHGHDTSVVGREKSGKCKQCGREQKAMWTKNHPNIVKQRWESWIAKNKVHVEDSKLKRLYGLSYKDRQLFLFRQHNRCAICNTHLNFVYRAKLDVDHNHKTGKVRGLLCSSCNNILGRCKDNVHILKMAVKYLIRNQ